MELRVKEENIMHEYAVKEVKDLLEGIKDFCQVFLPDVDDIARELYDENSFKELNGGLHFYYVEPQLSYAIKCFNLLDEVSKMDNINDIVSKLKEFNKVFSDAKYNIEFIWEN